jgi:hypothetical protein
MQVDELFALLSAVKDGAVSAAEAIARLERTPQWVWVAMDPESKLLLAIDVGQRTRAMAQRLVHHVTQVLAPDCAPLLRIPRQSCHRFQVKPATDSTAKLPPVPHESCH